MHSLESISKCRDCGEVWVIKRQNGFTNRIDCPKKKSNHSACLISANLFRKRVQRLQSLFRFFCFPKRTEIRTNSDCFEEERTSFRLFAFQFRLVYIKKTVHRTAHRTVHWTVHWTVHQTAHWTVYLTAWPVHQSTFSFEPADLLKCKQGIT